MVDWKLNLYHQMPPLVRNLASSVRGNLRFWHESGWLEVVDSNDQLLPARESGDFTTKRTVEDLLRQHMGETEVVFEKVSAIPREANGKFRAVVCSINPENRQRV